MSELYNESGAIDPTCAEAISKVLPRPGEVWVSAQSKRYVCLKRHERFCNALMLRDTPFPGTIELNPRIGGFTNPAQITYVNEFNYGFKEQDMPEAEFQELLERVSDKIGMTITASETPVRPVIVKPIVTEVRCKSSFPLSGQN